MIKPFINELLYMNFGGQTPLMLLAEQGANISLEPLLASDYARAEIIKGFAKCGKAVDEKHTASKASKQALVAGYIQGGFGKLAMTITKSDPSLFDDKIQAEAFLGKKRAIHTALAHPSNNPHYNDYLKAAIKGYALGNHQELLRDLLAGTQYIEKAVFYAAQAGHTALVGDLVETQLKPLSIDLLKAAALQGYATGHHIKEAADLITQGAPTTLWANTISDACHCDNKINAIMLLASVSEDIRDDTLNSISRILSIELNENDVAHVNTLHKKITDGHHVLQGYQHIINGSEEALAEVNLETVTTFISKQLPTKPSQPEP